MICLEAVVKMGKAGKKVEKSGSEVAIGGSAKAERVDVAVIVGHASQIGDSPREAKQKMTSWRAAAQALAPIVLEGKRVNKAFADLRARAKKPIGKLYIICHADVSGIGEIDARGRRASTTIDDVAGRIKNAAGALGGKAPKLLQFLSCYGGGSPETMSKIGRALGATLVRAPIQQTVIGSIFIHYATKKGRKIWPPLTRAKINRLDDSTLSTYITQVDGLKYYDFVPGVPHPKSAPSVKDKLKALVGILRKTGSIPRVSFNEAPGGRDAVPYWKASIKPMKPTDKLSDDDFIRGKGLIEVKLKP